MTEETKKPVYSHALMKPKGYGGEGYLYVRYFDTEAEKSAYERGWWDSISWAGEDAHDISEEQLPELMAVATEEHSDQRSPGYYVIRDDDVLDNF